MGEICCFAGFDLDEGLDSGRCRRCRALFLRGHGETARSFRRRMRRHAMRHALETAG